MSIALPGRVVVLDYGGVIAPVPSEQDRARIVEAAGVPAADLWPAYRADRDRLDHGLISTTQYWTGIGRACGVEWDLARIQRLWALDTRGWTGADPEVVALIAALDAGGTRVALLSNAPAEYGGLFRFSPLGAVLERVFVSAELLLLKPDPAIYRHVAASLAVPPEDLVLVDDREANVRGAESIGVTSHLYTTPLRLHRFLTTLAV